MKQSFLNNCKGLSLAEAEKLVTDNGLKPYPISVEDNGYTVTCDVKHRQVILFHENKKVTQASPGNPGELEKETAEEMLLGLKLT